MHYLHTMLRVGDLERSVGFYSGVLGFAEVRRADYPDGKFTLVFWLDDSVYSSLGNYRHGTFRGVGGSVNWRVGSSPMG